MARNSAMNAGTSLPALDRFQEGLDKTLFFWMLLGGCAYMFITKWLLWPQLWVTTGPVIIIIIYGFLLAKTKRYQMFGEKAGDNLYYLGFLYTLISLAMSLIQYSLGANTIEEIITNFGIALFTTIAGMAGRVIMNQMREDIVDIETSARVELSDAAKKLRSELMRSIEDINQLRLSTRQSMEESKRQSVEIIGQFCATTQEANRQLLDKLSQTLGEATTTCASAITGALGAFESQTTSLNTHATRLTKNIEKTVDASDRLWQRLEAIEAPSDIINRKLDAVVSTLSQGASNFHETTRAFRELSPVMQEITVNTANALTGISLMTEAMQRHLKVTTEVQTQIGGIGAVIEDLHTRMTGLNESVGGFIMDHQQQTQILRQALQDEVEVINQYGGQIRQVSQDSVAAVNGLNAAAHNLGQMGGRISATLAELDGHIGSLANSTRQTLQANSEQREVLHGQYQALQELTRSLENQAQAVRANLQELPAVEQDLARIGEHAQHLEAALAGALRTLNDGLSGQQRLLTASREQIEHDLSVSRELRSALEKDTQRMQDAVTEMNTTLVQLARGIVESLK